MGHVVCPDRWKVSDVGVCGVARPMESFRCRGMWYGPTDGKPVAGGCEAAEEVAGAAVEAVVDATEAVVEVAGRPSVTWL